MWFLEYPKACVLEQSAVNVLPNIPKIGNMTDGDVF